MNTRVGKEWSSLWKGTSRSLRENTRSEPTKIGTLSFSLRTKMERVPQTALSDGGVLRECPFARSVSEFSFPLVGRRGKLTRGQVGRELDLRHARLARLGGFDECVGNTGAVLLQDAERAVLANPLQEF